MTAQTEHASVKRVRTELESHGVTTEIRHLADTARTAVDAANVLEVEVGQIASSIVFKIDTDQGERPLLVVTSGADFVRLWSGFAIGGVSPIGWLHDGEVFQPQTIVDTALSEYAVVWGACGHTHVVCSLDFDSLLKITAGTALTVAAD